MRTPIYKMLYVQVLVAIVIGVVLGSVYPDLGQSMKPLGDAFIGLIKMIIGPVIFCTVVTGIAGMSDMKEMGRVGGKALLYFEVVSTFALVIGLIAGHLLMPGSGFNADPASLDTSSISKYVQGAETHGTVEFLMSIIPHTFFSGFTEGNILQILLVSILTGAALAQLGEKTAGITRGIASASQVFFRIVHYIARLAPIGAFGAIAFTVGKYGLHALLPMLKLVGSFYLTAIVFVLVVLGTIARLMGFRILAFIRYIREELLIVLGTSSSEAALPMLIEKLERAGCSRKVVGLVVPTGYSFNLDGTNIYMTLAVLFISQATNADLSLVEQLTILVVAMLTSKGASGVTGAGFITLAATLAVVPQLSVAGMVLILGVDRFMSECRALTNFVGNGVATVVISIWEKALDREQFDRAMAGDVAPLTEAD